jgi:capsular polysaccharide biosynthesis protein
MKYWQIIKVRFVTILLVFLLTAVTTTVVSFFMPKTYMSMSRISLEKDTSDIAPLNGIQSGETAFDPYFIQTELEVIQSQKVLDKVVSKCRLTNVWKRLNGGKSLTPREARKILKKAIDIRQFRNTSIIELRAYDRKPTEAQEIAQALAEEYQTHRTDAQKKRVEIIDYADLPVQAVRPNIPLNITLGVVAGLILGVGLAFFIAHLDTAQGVLIVDAKNLLIKSGFNVSVDDLSTHHLAGGDVAMVATGMIKAKEKNIDLSFDQACTLDLQDKGLLEEKD